MDSTGRKTTPLFMKTYSKFQSRPLIHKPTLSPVFPGDKPTYNNTNSPCKSDTSESSPDPTDHQPRKSTSKEKNEMIPSKQRRPPPFKPLINISNVLSNKPCLSKFKHVSSPFKKGKKTRKRVDQLDSIQESDADSTSTEEDMPASKSRSRRTVNRSALYSIQVAPNTEKRKKVGPLPGFNMMIRGNRILPLGTPLASSTAIESATSEISEDITDSTDYELTSSSDRSDGSQTLTEEMSSEENTLTERDGGMSDEEEMEEEDDDAIETMRDLPDNSILQVRGKRLNLTPKRVIHKRADPIKIPLERLSLSNSQYGSKKQVSFLLSSKEDQGLADSGTRRGPYQAQQLPPKPSILKTSNSESRENSFSKSMVACNEKQTRMSSTPTRGNKKTGKMMQLSFDVSAVSLPSYDISDLVVEGIKENRQKSHNAEEVLPPVEIKESDQIGEAKTTNAPQANQINSTVIEYQPSRPSDVVTTRKPSRTSSTSTQPSNTTRPQRMLSDPKPILTVQPYKNRDLLDGDMHEVDDVPIPEDTQDMILDSSTVQSAESHATPRSQLKRSSPESHVPFTPSKRKWRMKGPSCVTEEIPHVVNGASNGERPQGKRLEYEEKGAGVPECCITQIDHSTCSHEGVEVIRYVSEHKISPKQLQEMPQDVIEVLFA